MSTTRRAQHRGHRENHYGCSAPAPSFSVVLARVLGNEKFDEHNLQLSMSSLNAQTVLWAQIVCSHSYMGIYFHRKDTKTLRTRKDTLAQT